MIKIATYRTSSSKARKRLAGISVMAIFAAFIVALLGLSVHYIGSPAIGVIEKVNAAVFTPTPLDMTPISVSGSNASFTYPKGLTVRPAQRAGGAVLENYQFSRNDVVAWNLAIAVQNTASGKIEDNSSYQFRKMHPERFSESAVMVNGQTVPIMTDHDAPAFAKVAFLAHGSHQATISLTGAEAQSDDSLQSTLMMVVNSWQWL